jgi:ribosomal protein S18 acetylase RimI-like enzyme
MIAQLARSEFGRRAPMTEAECAQLIPGLKRIAAKRVLLASSSDQICGVAICFIHFATFAGREMLKIQDLFVATEHRHRGIGKQLVEGAIECAREIGCAYVNIEVASSNPSAIGLYRALGFVDWVTPTQFLELKL